MKFYFKKEIDNGYETENWVSDETPSIWEIEKLVEILFEKYPNAKIYEVTVTLKISDPNGAANDPMLYIDEYGNKIKPQKYVKISFPNIPDDSFAILAETGIEIGVL